MLTETGSHAMANMRPETLCGATCHCYSGLMRNDSAPHHPDRVDRAIVSRLQEDGRIANVDLADAVSLSPSACLRRVKALEASGIIEGYRAEISRTRAGLGLTAFVGLRVDGHSRATSDQIERALMTIPAVVACYVVTGSDDFMVEVAAQDLADYEKILLDEILAIPAVVTGHSVFAIRTVLSRGPVPLTNWR